MSTRRWILGRIISAMGLGAALLLHPAAAQATNRNTKPITSAYGGAVCTKGGCASDDADAAGEGDRKLGTAITWMASPDAAWRAAVDESKLVFMIQVSGNFARQEFT